jgi:dTDP-4-amino-4,6-dideoxygalactose transaminase
MTCDTSGEQSAESGNMNDLRPGRLYLSPPHMSGLEQRFVEDAFSSNWIAPFGPHVDAFEKEFAEYVGVEHAAAVSSGTAALHLGLNLLGVSREHEVLVSDFTFIATANVVTYQGARPVFIDSSVRTWNMDPDLLEAELKVCAAKGRLPKAVLAVDLYGQCADFGRIESICRLYGVSLIEDAAEALGATCNGKRAGSFGRCAAFSFNGNKIITTSGGGMLVSADEALVERARFLAAQARDPAPHYEHSTIGYNYRMSNLIAAIGRGQLRVINERVKRRREIFESYRAVLEHLPGITFMPEAPYGVSNRWLTCILVDPKEFGATREDIRLALEQENIESRPVWKPMHLQPVFRSCRVQGGSVGERIFERGLCLPSGTAMTELDIERVVAVVELVAKRGVRLVN